MRKNKSKFFIVFFIVLAVLATSVFGGYLIIDKALVPKYFGKYGINNLADLVDIVETIYTVPNEEDFIENPYSEFDTKNATTKFIQAGFPSLSTGELDFEAIVNKDYTLSPSEDFTDNFILLSDKEIASISNNIVGSGVLVSNYPDLAYINTLNIEVKQIIISPTKESSTPYIEDEDLDINSASKNIVSTATDAKLNITIKLDTESARKQISTNLNMPMFLVDWIIPDIIYVTSQLDTYINSETNERIYDNAKLSINSKTAKQSEVLLDLLISFIFPEDTFTIESFANELASLVITGINLLGNVEFATIKTSSANLSGIKLGI